MKTSPARRAAFSILRRVESESAYASTLLSSIDDLRDDDRALCHELVFGVLRRQLWLDTVLAHFAKRRIEALDLPVKLALRLGLYQLRFLSRIPPSAAVNESVNLVHAARLKSAAGFVNAVLRRAVREPDYDPSVDVEDPIQRLAVETSHPRWMIERWWEQLGFEEAASLARANNEPAPVAIRFTAKTIADESEKQRILDALESTGGEVRPSSVAPNAWRIVSHRNSRSNQRVEAVPDARSPAMPALLREFSRAGLIYFQDEASQLVSHLMVTGNTKPDDRFLDVCAAPGSKTTHLASLLPRAIIVAGDFREHRLRTLADLARQQGAGNIHLFAHDATRRLPFADAAFGSVLVDAPCSGTGTLRGNPEIRWRLKASDITEVASKQTEVLANAAAMVLPGGRLVYSTCSLEPEENEAVVTEFIKDHQDFSLAQFEASQELRTKAGYLRTWPHRQGVDGFFVAAFERWS
jgi:16S rRNA (cytosine967-C5)-methyltransferase